MSELNLPPHPVFRLPTLEQARSMSLEDLNAWLAKRQEAIDAEKRNPFQHGFEPEVWHLVDDLLVDGNKVILDLSRIAKLWPEGMALPADFVPKEIEGATEIWIPGSNRSSKSEYAGKKMMKLLMEIDGARTWSFADTGPISIARQQPIFWKYMPVEIKRIAAETGKAKQGVTLNVSYKQKTGFAEQSFVLPNGSQHWYKNYEQDPGNVEGDQLDGLWLDELRNLELLRTLRGRMHDRGGLVIVTFTSIDENYTAVVNEYDRGARTVLEVPAELLPIKRPKNLSGAVKSEQHSPATVEFPRPITGALAAQNISAGGNSKVKASQKESWEKSGLAAGWKTFEEEKKREEEKFEIIGYEKVPRVKVAGPGGDGNLKANIVYFHITDNPYFGYEGAMQRSKPGRVPLFGKERFYRAYRNATRAKILSRVYGLLQGSSSQKFPKFNDAVHVIQPDRIPRFGTNYHLADPCDGRMWAQIWMRIAPNEDRYVYREWPSTGGPWAYIPGVGDPGPWTVPGKPADGVRGPGQDARGFGLDAYKAEIARVEGWNGELAEEEEEEDEQSAIWNPRTERFRRRIPRRLGRVPRPEEPAGKGEPIAERWMDSRYGAAPSRTREGTTTLIEQCAEIGLEFKAASGKEIGEGVALINDWLDYDSEVPLGKFSPVLGRLNAPKLFISSECPNVIFAVREWTGKDGNKGACKDWIDLLRYAALAELTHIGEGAYVWT
jgi:hypothetical protein